METAVYKKEEFIEAAVRRGYAQQGICAIYVQNHPKTVYTEEDLQDLWRFNDRLRDRDDMTGVFSPGSGKTWDEKKQGRREEWLFGGGVDPVERARELRKERVRKRRYDDDPYLG